MSVYVDSSFVVSIYLTDANSTEADRRMASFPSPRLTPLHLSEFVHAIEQNVFRGKILPSQAQVLYNDFDDDCLSSVWLRTSWPPLAFGRSVELARAHIARLGVRTLDSLHVSAALELGATEFWTFDDRQARLARAVGLSVS